jgi:hypothetical protein
MKNCEIKQKRQKEEEEDKKREKKWKPMSLL